MGSGSSHSAFFTHNSVSSVRHVPAARSKITYSEECKDNPISCSMLAACSTLWVIIYEDQTILMHYSLQQGSWYSTQMLAYLQSHVLASGLATSAFGFRARPHRRLHCSSYDRASSVLYNYDLLECMRSYAQVKSSHVATSLLLQW